MPNKLDSDKLWWILKVALSVAMGLAYIAIGILVMMKHWFMVPLDAYISYILGSLLIIYGLYRVYRIVRNIFN